MRKKRQVAAGLSRKNKFRACLPRSESSIAKPVEAMPTPFEVCAGMLDSTSECALTTLGNWITPDVSKIDGVYRACSRLWRTM